MRSHRPLFCILITFVALLFAADVALGSVPISPAEAVRALSGLPISNEAHSIILWQFRLPKAITALLAGAALGMAGLHMQTLFRNPLADPFVLGVSSGASLGVALVVLMGGTTLGRFTASLGLGGSITILLAASLGSATIFTLIMLLAARVQSPLMLIIISLMVGYLTTAVVSLLMYFSAPDMLREFTFWNFGSFGGTTWPQLAIFAPATLLALTCGLLLAKPLDALLLGASYAHSMGVNVPRAQRLIALIASILAACVTAFCGPIGFLGVAVPHLARGVLRSSLHHALGPGCMVMGAGLALLFDVLANAGPTPLPINILTALLGAPLVTWVILRQRQLAI